MAKILITGGTGLIGKQLQQKLTEKNYEVAILTRNPKKENEFRWNIKEEFIDEKALENTNFIIHLAGAGIADKRWSIKRKQELIDSRVKSTNLLFNKVQELKIPLQGFISASGIGYYGAITSDKIFNEEDAPHNDFISEVCTKWEASANPFKEVGIPVTILRTGIVLSKKGGALQKINTPLFLSALGNGQQFMPWIHIDDVCSMYINAIENNLIGVYNAVAPEQQTNQSFTKILGKAFKKPVLPINIPSFVMQIAFGELACILLKGSRVSSQKILNTNYKFEFPTLKKALMDVKG